MLTRHRGFSLVELMVVVVIASLLLAMAVPSFSTWLTNSRIRNVTTEFYAGLQQARAEAIARNGSVRFQSVSSLTSACSLSTSGAGWVINRVATGDDVSGKCDVAVDPNGTTAPFIIAKRAPDVDTRVSVSASDTNVVFNSLGRSTSTISYEFTSSNSGGCATQGGDLSCLRVLVSASGQMRMCNPRFPPGDPQACPVP